MANVNSPSGSGDEKKDPTLPVEHAPSIPVVDAETEARLIKKLDRRIIPVCCWIYLMNFMDRVGIGNARVFGIEEDLGMVKDSNQFQLAVSILFVTYCLFETPSNLIIKRMKPARYLAGLVFIWGVIATFTGFVHNYAALIACRLLLGLFEAGLFPGIMLYLTTFYTKRHISLRNAYFYSISAISGAVGGLVSYGIGQLDNDGMGTAGWRAWRWIITINGIPTILTAPLVLWILPNDPETASFLSEEDRRNLILLRQAEIGQTTSGQQMHKEDVIAGIKDWKIWALSFAQFCSHSVLYSFSVFLPTIIRDMGQAEWGPAEINALTIPVYIVGFGTYLCVAFYSDRIQQRGIFCLAGAFVMIIGYALLLAHQSVAMSFVGCFFVSAGLWACSGSGMAWITVNQPRYGKRAFASGIFITIGNAAGVPAPFLYTDRYSPRYIPGYSATIGMLFVAMFIHSTIYFHFRRKNIRKQAGLEDWRIEGKTEEEINEMGEHNPRYMYTL
jgi:MFS family permease